MPAETRRITDADIIDRDAFAAVRKQRRDALLPVKRLRRIAVGPHCTFYFENFDTMLLQVQEMLYIEGGGAEQLADELEAYNPLIPQGDELVATVMFEIPDAERRLAILRTLGGVEHQMFVDVDGERIPGEPTDDIERTTPDGKTSSVHFMRFRFSEDQKTCMRDPSSAFTVGIAHENYGHMAALSPATRKELARDFS